jgi:phosphatidylinositol alpha-1,6-mannosyltransferase
METGVVSVEKEVSQGLNLESALPEGEAARYCPLTGQQTKILFLADAFLPHAGGSREYYYNIYRQLVALGNSEVKILTKKVPGWREFDRHASTSSFRIHRRFKPLASWKYWELPKGIGPFVQALWSVLRNSPDMIHAGDLYPQGLIALALKKLFRTPYVIYCHGEEITQTDHYRFQPRMRNFIYRQADAVIANSEFAKQELLRIGVSEKRIHKITPGVDSIRFQMRKPNQDLVRRYGLEGKTVILTVARLVPRKGHRAALEAFAKLGGEFRDAHYLIVGTGPEESRIRQQVEALGLQKRVTLAGFVPGERLPDLYSVCDLMLLPNRQEADGDVEGFGIVFLEANAAGKPVIGGKSGGAVEAIVDGVTGYLVDPDDPDEIAKVMRRLLGDPCLRSLLGAAGRQRSSEEYGWAERADSLNRINVSLLHPLQHVLEASSNSRGDRESQS